MGIEFKMNGEWFPETPETFAELQSLASDEPEIWEAICDPGQNDWLFFLAQLEMVGEVKRAELLRKVYSETQGSGIEIIQKVLEAEECVLHSSTLMHAINEDIKKIRNEHIDRDAAKTGKKLDEIVSFAQERVKTFTANMIDCEALSHSFIHDVFGSSVPELAQKVVDIIVRGHPTEIMALTIYMEKCFSSQGNATGKWREYVKSWSSLRMKDISAILKTRMDKWMDETIYKFWCDLKVCLEEIVMLRRNVLNELFSCSNPSCIPIVGLDVASDASLFPAINSENTYLEKVCSGLRNIMRFINFDVLLGVFKVLEETVSSSLLSCRSTLSVWSFFQSSLRTEIATRLEAAFGNMPDMLKAKMQKALVKQWAKALEEEIVSSISKEVMDCKVRVRDVLSTQLCAPMDNRRGE